MQRDKPIKPSKNGKYNLDFIDWNNEWERASEIERKIENNEEISDEEEKQRVLNQMNVTNEKYGVLLDIFPFVKPNDIILKKECYICLKYFTKSSKIKKLPCDHLFCVDCLSPWLKTNSLCPTCKFKLKEDDNNENI